MSKVDNFTLEIILYDYWQDKNKLAADKDARYSDEERLDDLYTHAIQLVFAKERLHNTYLVRAETFKQEVMDGSFNNYDGIGYYLDWDGNEIGGVDCSNMRHIPENAVFVAWYNK